MDTLAPLYSFGVLIAEMPILCAFVFGMQCIPESVFMLCIRCHPFRFYYVCLANTMLPIQITHVWFIVHGFNISFHCPPFHAVHICNLSFNAVQSQFVYVYVCVCVVLLLRFSFAFVSFCMPKCAPQMCGAHTHWPCIRFC